ncbi:MAG TPA: hypothetical protein VGV38_08910 [Pyrinomonadaceae bacterium]|nr:hypothetical protein [Pyrinomonadaceae bacterium]
MSAALSQLDGLILRFARDLHAKGLKRFDAESSAEMRRDLEEIEALSVRVKKGSEKFGEAAR